MKFVVVFALVLAAASAQFAGFPSSPPPRYQPGRFPSSPAPLLNRFPVTSTPVPFVPRPSAVPVVNRVASSDQAANIISYNSDIAPDGSFAYSFQTDNGIAAEAQGTPRDFGGNPPVIPIVIQGRYSYTSPDGQPIDITYTADENGYQAQGAAIPTPHPIPEAILRALDFIARNPPAPQKK